MQHVSAKLDISERRTCRVLGQHRSTQRHAPKMADDEAALTAAIIDWARQYGRYGYRRITALLRAEGWVCNHKRVERIWRREGLKVPVRQPKRGRLRLNDGSCVRLRPERVNHVWAYDFVEDRTRDGRRLRMLNVVDEFTRECLSIRVACRVASVVTTSVAGENVDGAGTYETGCATTEQAVRRGKDKARAHQGASAVTSDFGLHTHHTAPWRLIDIDQLAYGTRT